jgi:hypothetical protein
MIDYLEKLGDRIWDIICDIEIKKIGGIIPSYSNVILDIISSFCIIFELY